MKAWKKGDRIRERYEVDRILSGGMGDVYIAYDHVEREVVAIKTFRDEFAAEREVVQRFISEAEIWVRLDKHKNIVRAKYVMEISGKPHIFLEYVPGGDLRSYMAVYSLSIPIILEFGMDFCRAMDYAHRKLGIVHRDIKPENCLITGDRVLKVTDFGIAAFHEAMSHADDLTLSTENGSLTRTGSFLGTVPYASPEQFRDMKRLDTRSDIYSFGILLYEMIAGKTPFWSDSLHECIQGHLSLEPPDPCGEREGISRELGDLVLKCLSKEKDMRFADFGELEGALQAIYMSTSGTLYPEPEEDDDFSARELLNKGASLSALGKDAEAIGYFDMALEINPCYMQAWFNKGASLFTLGRSDEAMVCNERALKISPDSAEAWSNKGVSLAGMGRRDEAIRCFDRALEINPSYDDALLNRGLSFHALGRYDEALRCFDRALDISPRYARAWSYRGITMSLGGGGDEALSCCDRALGLKPNDAELLYNKGLVLSTLGRDEEALGCYDRALEIHPRYAAAWTYKGLSLSILGKDRDAIQCYDMALELIPHFVEAWINKGLSYAILGNYDKAILCYDEALNIQPRHVQAWANRSFSLSALGKKKECMECLRQLERIDRNLARRVKAELNKQ